MRVFIALTPPGSLLKEILGYRYKLQKALEGWSLYLPPPENIHLTLSFLGSRMKDEVSEAKNMLQELASSTEVFSLKAGPAEFFPSRIKAAGIWVNLTKTGELQSLKDNLDNALIQRGLNNNERKEFRPHITILRIREKANLTEEAASYLENYYFKYLMHCREIALVESMTLPEGAVYKTLLSVKLR